MNHNVNAFLSFSDVIACLASGTQFNSICFSAAVFQTRVCWKMSQKVSWL